MIMDTRYYFLVLFMTDLNVFGNPMPNSYQQAGNGKTYQGVGQTTRNMSKTNIDPIIVAPPTQAIKFDTYQVYDPNYPMALINSLDLSRFNHFFGEDYEDKVGARFNEDEQGLCQSSERTEHPQKALSRYDIEMTIVNHDNFRQGIRMEKCHNEYSNCLYSNNFPLGLIATCKQHYVYRRLLAIDHKGRPVEEFFKLPSCCKCMVTSSSGANSGFGSRIGEEMGKTKKNNSKIFFPENP